MGFLSSFSANVRRSPRFALVLGLLIYLLCLVVLVPVFLYSLGPIYNLNSSELQTVLGGHVGEREASAWAFRTAQAGNQLLTWGLAGWIMASLMLPPAHRELRLTPPDRRWQPLLATVLMLASLPLVQWLQIDADAFDLPGFLDGIEAWMREQEEVFGTALESILRVASVPVLLANLAVFALVPALCEEVFFRGFLQRQLMRLMPPLAAVGTQALIFSFIHFQFYGFFARAALGALLGYVVYRSGSLWSGVLGHFVFNGISVVAAYLAATSEAISPDLAGESYRFPVYVIGASLLAVGGLLYLFESKSPGPPFNRAVPHE